MFTFVADTHKWLSIWRKQLSGDTVKQINVILQIYLKSYIAVLIHRHMTLAHGQHICVCPVCRQPCIGIIKPRSTGQFLLISTAILNEIIWQKKAINTQLRKYLRKHTIVLNISGRVPTDGLTPLCFTVEVWKRITNFIPQFILYVITYPCSDWN